MRVAIAGRTPGDEVSIVFERRGGERVTAMLKLVADPRVEIVTIEETGKMPTGAQRTFRRNWFGSER